MSRSTFPGFVSNPRLAVCLVALCSALAVQGGEWTPPRGLEGVDLLVPAENPMTEGKIHLGEKLFFDKRLSKTKAMSCETCHVPEKGWTDNKKVSEKFDGSLNTRNTPTLYGVGFYPNLYWDGRAKGLEAQILAAWKGQMGADPEAIATELEAVPAYAAAFRSELGGPATGERIVMALASFVRTIQAGDTAWDRLPQQDKLSGRGDIPKGFKVFSEKAACTLCHLPPLFSDMDFHNIGIGFDTEKPDGGRGKALTDAATKANQPVPPEAAGLTGAFKTPSLRGVFLTAPYFHDGRAATVEEAATLLISGGIPNPNHDPLLQPQKLTPKERKQLLAFLKAMTPEVKPYPRPQIP